MIEQNKSIDTNDISIIIPVRNESGNIPVLVQEISSVFETLGKKYEIIIVDDHSTDNTYKVLSEIKKKYREVNVFKNTIGNGKDDALKKGFSEATGKIIITMDGDLQDDPANIPLFLEKMKNCDMICGVRKNRKDNYIRILCSKIANIIRRMIINDDIHDGGCTYRAMKRECALKITGYERYLHGTAHCFYPFIALKSGYSIREIDISHRKRGSGRSNFHAILGRWSSGLKALIALKKIKIGEPDE